MSAVSSAAHAVSYTETLGDGGVAILNHNVTTADEADEYTLTLNPTPGILEVSATLFGVTLPATGGITLETGDHQFIPVTYTYNKNNVLATFLQLTNIPSSPLILTLNWVGAGSYLGYITYTATNPAGSPVPGPIAGAGIPAAFAFGGLLWARRRKAAAA